MKNRGGRPRLRPMRKGDKVPMGLNVPLALRAKIVESSKQSGRSLTQDMEVRLERSFRDDEVMAELRTVRALLERFLLNSPAGR